MHNVICVHDPDDMLNYRQVNLDIYGPMYNPGALAEGAPSHEACTHAHEHCDYIAHQMWEDYNCVREDRGRSVVVDNPM